MDDNVEPTPERIARAERDDMIVKGDGRYKAQRQICHDQLARLAIKLGTIDGEEYVAGRHLQDLHARWTSHRVTMSYGDEVGGSTPVGQLANAALTPETRLAAAEQFLAARFCIGNPRQWNAVYWLCIEDRMLSEIGALLGYKRGPSANKGARIALRRGLGKLAVAWRFREYDRKLAEIT